MSLQDKVLKAEEHKAHGNDLFKAGQYQEAVKAYYYAYLNVKGIGFKPPGMAGDGDDESLITQGKDICLAVLLNLAACQLKLERYDRAIVYCDDAIKVKETAKAYFRRGQAHFGLNNLIKAENDLNRALAMQPNGTHLIKKGCLCVLRC